MCGCSPASDLIFQVDLAMEVGRRPRYIWFLGGPNKMTTLANGSLSLIGRRRHGERQPHRGALGRSAAHGDFDPRRHGRRLRRAPTTRCLSAPRSFGRFQQRTAMLKFRMELSTSDGCRTAALPISSIGTSATLQSSRMNSNSFSRMKRCRRISRSSDCSKRGGCGGRGFCGTPTWHYVVGGVSNRGHYRIKECPPNRGWRSYGSTRCRVLGSLTPPSWAFVALRSFAA
jgi:hypothetical protein